MPRIIFRNAQLFDSATATLIPQATVVVKDERIDSVSFLSSALPSAPDDQVFDLAGRTLLPGLIDAHVHVTATVPDFFQLSLLPQSLITAQAKDLLAQMLARGFTTVRDAGGADSGLVRAVDQGHFAGPRLYIAGRAISQTGGHGDPRPEFFAGAQCACCGAVGLLGRVADGVPAVRQAVREEIRNGAHHVKVMAGGGVSTPNDPLDGTQFSIQEMRAIVEEAEAARTYVMAHAYSPAAIERAITCGVRSIEHGNLLDADTARLMAEHGAFLVPTLSTYAAIARRGNALGWSEAMLAKTRIVKEQGLNALKIAWEAGVRIGLGSDLLGDMMMDQLEELTLREGVMPASEILRSATAINAEIMGLTGKAGAIVPGAWADLLVLDGDPLKGLAIFKDEAKRLAVMKGGCFFINHLSPHL